MTIFFLFLIANQAFAKKKDFAEIYNRAKKTCMESGQCSFNNDYQKSCPFQEHLNSFIENPVPIPQENLYEMLDQNYIKHSLESPLPNFSYSIGFSSVIDTLSLPVIEVKGFYGLSRKSTLYGIDLQYKFPNDFKAGLSFLSNTAKSKVKSKDIQFSIKQDLKAFTADFIYEFPLKGVTPYAGISAGMAYHDISVSKPDANYKSQYNSFAYGFKLGITTKSMSFMTFDNVELDIAYDIKNFGFKKTEFQIGGIEPPQSHIEYTTKNNWTHNITLGIKIKI